VLCSCYTGVILLETPPAPFFFFFFSFLTWSGSVAQAVLELKILLPLPPECWDYRCTSPHPVPGLYYFLNCGIRMYIKKGPIL
jgi:hypothetical protein